MKEQGKIKQKILVEISKTENLVADYKEMSKPVSPDDAIGRISRMDAINNKSITEASLRQAEEKLRNLNIVLSKIGTNDFGKCLSCGEEIPIGRILFKPDSLHCVRCAR